MPSEPKDPRSTYRKRARKVLEQIGRPLYCGSTGYDDENYGEVNDHGCGRSPVDGNAPGGFYPSMGTLQVNHINKELSDLDPINLEYLCASCHRTQDNKTAKGVSTIDDEFGYYGS